MDTAETFKINRRRPRNFQKKIMVLFGTRPEAIKLAPVIRELKRQNFETRVVCSNQHTDLLEPFRRMLEIDVDHDLKMPRRTRSITAAYARILERFDAVLTAENPDFVFVQGDTTTALAGATAAFNRRVPVGHVEAGLRSGNASSPFPEEMNRRLITRMATMHFAATADNRRTLIAEGVAEESVCITGNPVIDALEQILARATPSSEILALLEQTRGQKRILLTTHRRESFGAAMTANLRVIREFIAQRPDTCLFFPVHPNPNVRRATEKIFASDTARVHLLAPLGYIDFLTLMKHAELIVSDSGGVQEEAPSLGKPLLILRENTERDEVIRAGIAKLVGGDADVLRKLLEENYENDEWIRAVKKIPNPFGDGKAAARIVRLLENTLFPTKQVI